VETLVCTVRQSCRHRADFATHHLQGLQGKGNANPIQSRRDDWQIALRLQSVFSHRYFHPALIKRDVQSRILRFESSTPVGQFSMSSI
jgi:hypothetical protein